ncbi:MAG: hypothetical protein ACI97A_000285 [Planctomycetota bacterium]|jgi:hypothetical protein
MGITMPNKNTPPFRSEKTDSVARPGPDLRHQDLRGRNLRGHDLQGADLRSADLRDADLRGTDLFGARLDRANLEGCRIEMTRIVEIWIPRQLPLNIVNQIRAFDFQLVMTRFVGPNRNSQCLSCPYESAAVRPLLYEWGSKTWHQGSDWAPPSSIWTMEEIIACVLEHLGCAHDLQLPFTHPEGLALEASS